MGVLDFKEIPQANIADGNQDSFELFAREFLNSIGFSIVENPDRGQDGGRDLIVLEKRNGIIGDSEVRWLVSCKHKAHSGNAVLQSDEEDLYDRVQTHKCNGFMGIYSTVPSSSLHNKFEALKEKCEVKIFDHEEIERVLLNNKSANKLIQRFFPDYYNKSKLPANILSEYSPLRCRKCGKDLLQRDILDKYTGIVVFVQDMDYYYDRVI